jgi:hypothetical protein
MKGGTASSADQALTGRFWNGAIQNYWNEIAQSVTDARDLRTAERARVFALLNLALAEPRLLSRVQTTLRAISTSRCGAADALPQG